MIRRPPRSTLTGTLLPYTTLFRSVRCGGRQGDFGNDAAAQPCCRSPLDLHVRARGGAVAAFLSGLCARGGGSYRSEEHTSELQSLMRTSYAVFCLKKKIAQSRRLYTDNIIYTNSLS